MANWITSGKNTPLNAVDSGVPNMGDALIGWMQPMVFEVVNKTIPGFELVETTTPVSFRGVIQPLGGSALLLKPEGQRDWDWRQVHSDPSLILSVDDVVIYLGKQYRVMVVKDYSLYAYLEYHLISDYTGSDPAEVTP